ncbi:YceI family protein [Cyclobacterium marinum]|uniref:YceI family protein n=1 Tax=Cyclobacterium marinum (strain ATCC 25205 / DSM 745 / LMG 13164 / NCIMB 1802) TaxID=880070 RepID=G0J483_CYCMS|nr:YceI family protein [Cyclobacterium marinum]AEL27509.1 YceI family protein [Cyclobacterium marinum DSM 745]MBI0397281.1 YceI family protein [Cyclobacterium marinum]
MYKNLKLTLFFILVLFLSRSVQVIAQQTYEVAPNPEMKVSGTSTLHDWDMISKEATGTASIRRSAGKVTAIQSVEVSMKVKSLKSGKSQMDKNAYNALKEEEYPEITFSMLEAHQNGGNDWKVSGRLQLAGETKSIPFSIKIAPEGENIILSGLADIKLTDFNVTPPTAVFGTIKTGDEMTIHINMKLNPIN